MSSHGNRWDDEETDWASMRPVRFPLKARVYQEFQNKLDKSGEQPCPRLRRLLKRPSPFGKSYATGSDSDRGQRADGQSTSGAARGPVPQDNPENTHVDGLVALYRQFASAIPWSHDPSRCGRGAKPLALDAAMGAAHSAMWACGLSKADRRLMWGEGARAVVSESFVRGDDPLLVSAFLSVMADVFGPAPSMVTE